MSISSEITRIQNAKTDLKSSIEAKGVSVPAEAKIDTYPTLVDSISSGGGQEISGQEEITVKFGENLIEGDAVIIAKTYNHDTSTKLTETAITKNGFGIAFDIAGSYLILGIDTEPYLIFLRNADGTFIIENNMMDIAPGSTVLGVGISKDGKFLALSCHSPTRVLIYKRNGKTFTRLSYPTDLPSGYGWGRDIAINADGTYVYVAHSSSPYISVYKRSEETFTKLPNFSTLLNTSPVGISLDGTNTYLAIAHEFSPYLSIYKRNGDTFTKLTSIDVMPTARSWCVCFSNNSAYLMVGSNASPYLLIYKRNGDNFNILSGVTTIPEGQVLAGAFSSDSNYLFISHQNSPYVKIYKRDGDSFNLTPGQPTSSPTTAKNVVSSFDSTYFATSHSSGNGHYIYKGSNFVDTYAYRSYNRMFEANSAIGVGYAKESGLAGEEKKVIKLWG